MGRSFLLYCTFCLCALGCFAQEETPVDDRLAAESGFGLALILGEPMGISAKLWFSEYSAINLGVGWSMYRRMESMRTRGAPYAYIDYLRHFFDEIKTRRGKFVYFIGIGIEGAYNYFEDEYTDKQYYGVRLPFGISYMFDNAPLDIFLETSPSIVFYFHGVSSDIGACAGIRYWF